MNSVKPSTPNSVALNRPNSKPTAQPKSPLSLLPPEWSILTAKFAAFWSDYLKGELGIASRAVEWIEQEGMTLQDFETATRRLKRPEITAKITHYGELFAMLGQEVAAVIKARKDCEKNQAVLNKHRLGFDINKPPQGEMIPVPIHQGNR